MKKSFTLVEILIVVAILGILAAVTLPKVQDYIQQTKESAAKDNLRILRTAIGLYTAQHKGVAPGYPNGDTSSSPNVLAFTLQMKKMATNEQGECRPPGTAGYPFGPYLSALPENPLNKLITITFIPDADEFPDEAAGDTGWIYKPATKEIRLNWPGADKDGVSYYDY
jgi:prepilin-type N-terminal cleavage/methylation domain-containing protein